MNQNKGLSRLNPCGDEALSYRRRSSQPEGRYHNSSKCCPDLAGCGNKAREDQGCRHGFGVENGVLAALYIPLQEFEGLYDLEAALSRGTLFHALDKPFYDGKEGGHRGYQR